MTTDAPDTDDRAARAVHAILRADALALSLAVGDAQVPVECEYSETFEGLSFREMDFGRVTLRNTEWNGCMFEKCTFGVLDGSLFEGCTFVDCNFDRARLEGVSFDGAVFQRTSFKGCVVQDSEWNGVDLTECVFSDLAFDGVSWDAATLRGGKLAQISGDASLSGVTLRDVDVDSFDTSEMTLTGCVASGATIPDGFDRLTGRRRRAE